MDEDTKETMESRQESQKLLEDFLQRICVATYVLSQSEEGDHLMDDSNNNNNQDAAHMTEQIAKNLLAACDTKVLSMGISKLPKLSVSNEEKPFVEDEDDAEIIKAYRYRRSDYLRKLLRAMAPISMNVAASVCSTVVASKTESSSMESQSIILFSHWLLSHRTWLRW